MSKIARAAVAAVLVLLCGGLAPVLWAQSLADEGAITKPVLPVKGNEDGLSLAAYTQVFEDRAGTYDLAQVRGTGTAWTPGPAEVFAFGASHSNWWVRTQIENPADEERRMVVDLDNPRQDYVGWHVLRNAGLQEQVSRAGGRLPFAQRALPTRDNALPIILQPHERVELYVQLKSYDGRFEPLRMRLFSARAFVAAQQRDNLLLGLYYGALLALALYNLLVLGITHEATFGLYALHLSCLVLWNFTFRSYAFEYFWPESPTFNNEVLAAFAAASLGSFGLFSAEFLRLRGNAPRWLYLLNLAPVAINALVAAQALLVPAALDTNLGREIGMASILVALATSIWLLSHGSRQARFFLAACVALGVGGGSYLLQIASLLPTNAFARWGVEFGSLVEILLLALGLIDSMNARKAQALSAERSERETQQALSQRLEQALEQRTRALELANRRMNELAITDELTGAFNRQYFTECCNTALRRTSRNGGLAFCMFDVDCFKSYNDRYGHQAGDAALHAIANAVLGELRRSGDALFRLGGGKFGILFTAPTQSAAHGYCERLCLTVRAAKLPHEGSATGIITASFGLGWWSDEQVQRLTPDHLYAVADGALYQAKSQGRDRVHAEGQTLGSPPLRLVSSRPPETGGVTG